jgi:hypothetical protein
LLERGVSRVANVAVSQLKHIRINYRIGSSSDPVIIPSLVEYVGVVTVQTCGVRTVFLYFTAFLYSYNQSDVKSVLIQAQMTNAGTEMLKVDTCLEAKNRKLL